MYDMWLHLAVVYIVTCISSRATRHPGSKAEGRVPEIDNYLLLHGEDISKGQNLDQVKATVKDIASSLGYRYNPAHCKYYLEVLDLIAKKGVKIINKERDRLDVILSSTAVHAKSVDGGAEFTYAMTRKNILEAFLDAIADYLINGMHEMGTDFLLSGEVLNRKVASTKIKTEM